MFSILANINLFEIILNSEITNRSYTSNERIFPTSLGILFLTIKTIFFGYMHATNFNAIPIFVLLVLISIKTKINFKFFNILILILITTSLIFAAFPIIQYYISPYLTILKSFNLISNYIQ